MRTHKPPVFLWLLLILMIASGAGGFAAGMTGWHVQRIWQSYLTNFVFWTGLAYGGVAFVAVMNTVNQRWGRPMKRLAESMGAFLPISLVLFVGIWFGREHIFPWIHEPLPKKAAWLNIEFLFVREGVTLLVLTLVALVLLYGSIKSDSNYLARGRKIPDIEEMAQQRLWRIQQMVSPFFAILYIFLLTLVAWDLIMSLSPHWYSTLFGAYFFVGCFYSALAGLFVLSALVYRGKALSPYLGSDNFHQLGKFQLGFLMVLGDFFFSQYLLIWYGNIPEETRFIIDRFYIPPWHWVSWAVFALIFVIPFFVLLNRNIKMKPMAMLGLSAIILIGMWLERFLLIVPSIWVSDTIPLGLPEFLITAGFFGLMGVCVLFYLRRFPLVPAGDPVFARFYMIREGESE